jgi:hypothetical protein
MLVLHTYPIGACTSLAFPGSPGLAGSLHELSLSTNIGPLHPLHVDHIFSVVMQRMVIFYPRTFSLNLHRFAEPSTPKFCESPSITHLQLGLQTCLLQAIER